MAGELPEYTAWVREQDCLGCGKLPCGEAHHCGRKGTGQKPHDDQAVPLCSGCHYDRHMLRGMWRGFLKEHRQAWEAMAVRDTRARAVKAGWDSETKRFEPGAEEAF